MQVCGEHISAPSLVATAMRKEELSMRVPTAEHGMASRNAPANGAAAAVRRAKPAWVCAADDTRALKTSSSGDLASQ